MQPAGPNNNWHYNHKLRSLARALRRNMIKKDEIKQRDLEEAGFHMLRFRDEEVLNRIDLVIIEIEKCIKEILVN